MTAYAVTRAHASDAPQPSGVRLARGRRRLRRPVLLAAAIAALSANFLLAAPGSAIGDLPAQVVTITPPVRLSSYPGIEYGRDNAAQHSRAIFTTWRVVQNTNNCCEAYLTASSDGRLFNFGGSWIDYSSDLGRTWREVRSLTPLVAGEGAIAAAPGGDIVGAAWDLNAGDQLQFYKYTAKTKSWAYMQMPLHAPFYDREWIGVVPGPVTIGGQTYPWISYVKGGDAIKDVWYYSTDGLHYLAVDSHTIEQLGETNQASPLPTHPDRVLDWVQANTNSGMTSLGGGGMLSAPEFFTGAVGLGTWGVLSGTSFTWTSYALPNGKEPVGAYQVDSAGRVHNVLPSPDLKGFDYRVSSDGSRHWSSVHVNLPPGYTMDPTGGGAGRQQWDFRANRQAGIAAVGIRAHSTKGTDQDLVYKIDISRSQPRLLEMVKLGLGDRTAGNGTASSAGFRMDFGSITILPGGRIAASFLDSTTHYVCCSTGAIEPPNTSPAVAIELSTQPPRG